MPTLPRFFYNGNISENSTVILDPDTAKHIWQVLRMKADDTIQLTDGKGTIAEGDIHTAERHKCSVTIRKINFQPRSTNLLHLCVSFTKNNSRNEWLLEKATELGVGSIVPVTTTRSEKVHIRHDRWEKILQSAILQSQQHYLPDLIISTPLTEVLKKYDHVQQKFIAHCIADRERQPLSKMLKAGTESVLLIGPEGDFTPDEVNLCMEHAMRNHSDLDPAYPLMPYGKDSRMALLAKATLTKNGVKRVSFLPMMIDTRYRAQVQHSGSQGFDDVVRYMEWNSDGFDHKFSVEGDEVAIS